MKPNPTENDVLDKLQVCQTCMGYEESIRVSYQSLLAALEAESKYGWVPLGRAGRIGERLLGHWFERIVIPAIFLLWLWVLTW